MARILLLILSALLLGAHYLRAGEIGLTLCWLSTPLLPLVRRRFVPWLIAMLSLLGAAIWVHTAWRLYDLRVLAGEPWLRAVIIIGVVSLVPLGVAASWMRRDVRAGHGRPSDAFAAPLAACIVAAAVLATVLAYVPRQLILIERFFVGGGWAQALWIGVYAGWLTTVVLVPKHARTMRPRVWLLFSVLFYGQLLLGLIGFERFLASGKLHLPIPAIIAAGPAFRGYGYFMAALFLSSIVLVGPAWCSWLCYFGGWDNFAALRQRRPRPLPRWRATLRLASVITIVGLAFLLGRLGVPAIVAAWLGALVGIVGIGIVVAFSRRRGVMVHCTCYCPIGWFATRLGKLNPMRVRIDESCTECMACTKFCRYDALSEANILARRVGKSCTLCGDCVTVCQKTHDIHYSCLGLSPARARTLFLVVVVAMQASFVGIAMI